MTRPTEHYGGIPAIQHLSDDELLRLLLGQDADALLSRHTLPDLFALHARPPVVQEHRMRYGACRTLAASTSMDWPELVSSGVKSMLAPGAFRTSPAEATVTWFRSAVAASPRSRLSPWRLNQAR